MDAVIAVVGTVLGTTLGAALTYVIQARGFERERSERLATERRASCVSWLTSSHNVFLQTRAAIRELKSAGLTEDERRKVLATVEPAEAQANLEALRLLCDDHVLQAAARMWSHIRRADVARGRFSDSASLPTWIDDYYEQRHLFIDAARKETGLGTIDWSLASAQGYPRR